MGLRAISQRFRTRLDPHEPARRPVAAGPTTCPQGTQAPVAGKPPPGHFRVVLRSLSLAGRRSNEAHVFWPRSGGSARLSGTCVRPRRHEESGAAILGGWRLSEARPRDEQPSSPTGARWSCGNVRRPSTGTPRSRLRHDTPIHATRRDRLGGPWRSRHSGIGTPCEKAFRQMFFSQDCSHSGTCASEGAVQQASSTNSDTGRLPRWTHGENSTNPPLTSTVSSTTARTSLRASKPYPVSRSCDTAP